MLQEVEDRAILNFTTVSENRPFIVVGIPAFNEEKMILRVVLEAQKFADAVVVCDDGSSDLTADIAKKLGAYVVKHQRNLGYGAAILSLFRRARELNADILVTLDADGQHDPKEIPAVVKPIVEGVADVVIGSRFIDANGTAEMPFYRRVGAQLITKLVNSSCKNGVKDAQSGFRAYNRYTLDHINISEAGMGASVEILLKASKHDLKICEVPSSCKYKNGDVANSTEHPIRHGVSVVMSIVRLVVEEKPLTFLGLPAILFLFVGTLLGIWMLQIYAVQHLIETNVALAALFFVIVGFFMMSTAIMLYAISRLSEKMDGKR